MPSQNGEFNPIVTRSGVTWCCLAWVYPNATPCYTGACHIKVELGIL